MSANDPKRTLRLGQLMKAVLFCDLIWFYLAASHRTTHARARSTSMTAIDRRLRRGDSHCSSFGSIRRELCAVGNKQIRFCETERSRPGGSGDCYRRSAPTSSPSPSSLALLVAPWTPRMRLAALVIQNISPRMKRS